NLREREAVCVVEFNQAILVEERFLKQKAKINWLKDGDANSAYFHIAVKSRVSRSRIEVVMNNEGLIFANDPEISDRNRLRTLERLNDSLCCSLSRRDMINPPEERMNSNMLRAYFPQPSTRGDVETRGRFLFVRKAGGAMPVNDILEGDDSDIELMFDIGIEDL
ncbi:hypothetical protein Tco_1100443, partial [Tanacetum coccineum]